MAFINENIFPNKYLFSNIRVVVTRGIAISLMKKKKKRYSGFHNKTSIVSNDA